MQIKLNGSKLTLLLPKDYERVDNGASLYDEMYHKRKAADIEMFHALASESYGNVVVSHINPGDAMPFDKKTLIEEIHASMTEEQGLIEVEAGANPRGFEYIYSIIKTYHRGELNVNYCVHGNIKYCDEMIEVLGSFFETRMTGLRSSMGWNIAMNAGFETDEDNPHLIKCWAEDPYDPEYTKGCRMILCERRGLDGMFPSDPLSQARELVLAVTEDSYYKTKEEIEAEHKDEKKNKKSKRKSAVSDVNKEEAGEETEESGQEQLQKIFSKDATRSGAYKVKILEDDTKKYRNGRSIDLNPVKIATATSKAADAIKSSVVKTTEALDKVKTPFEIPNDFRSKLNKPLPKELPGWGRREYIGFGKSTALMRGICLSWPVTESESLPLNDTKKLIDQYHEDMPKNTGLICGKCGITPKGNRYGYAICKMQMLDEEGKAKGIMDYELNLNIRINGKIHFINGSFQSRDGVPGNRVGALGIMMLGSSELKLITNTWQQDPYDSERKEGYLMNWTEDEKFDDLFPYHPLTELRRFVRYIIENN